jgi:hypothetical protein
MKAASAVVAVVVAVLLAGAAAGQQIPTGTLTGHVSDGKAPLPGAMVTLTSPNLQGARTATSTVNGDYILELLPPGVYTVRFELDGFETIETTVRISGALTSSVDSVMPKVTKIEEAVSVTGRADMVSTAATVATSSPASFVQQLPVSRDAQSYVFLAPATGPLENARANSLQLGGGVSGESLYLVNGAPNNDNVWGTFLPIYIEDAIQETTTSLANISAEYGRFTGGVVNVLTKSGGDEFHGSARLNLTNPKWTAPTPLTTERTDQLGKIWEGTFGGYVVKDRLWFFLAGRTTSQTSSLATEAPVGIPYDSTEREDRYEGKLTLALTQSHRLIGSYLKVTDDLSNSNYPAGATYDLAALATNSTPVMSEALNYTGVLSDNVFVEAQGSYRKRQFIRGAHVTDRIGGTPVWDDSTGALFNSPYFCAVCGGPPDTREATDAFAKVSWFLSSASAGSHDLTFGVDLYDDMWRSNEWQSGSEYVLDAASVSIVGTGTNAQLYPVFLPDASDIEYFPQFEASKGNHFKTESAFANDVWRLNDHLTFNIGVRFDKNDGSDEAGTKVVRDSKWSPRLSLTWDPKGDGATQVVLGFSEYVAGIDNAIANSATKTGIASFVYWYEGPPINADGNQLLTPAALQQVFDWISSIGGLQANPQLLMGGGYPGYGISIGHGLRSPGTSQWTAGVTRRLGARGFVRLDLVDKTWTDLYSDRVDMTTGHTTDPLGDVLDNQVIENDPSIRRRYQAAILQGDYHLGQRWHLGGNYTLSRLYGNDCGYGVDCYNSYHQYPEYWQPSWGYPVGYLGGDHRHELNLYAVWDALDTRTASLNLSVLQRVLSGRPYRAGGFVLVGPYVTNPGYAMPPWFEYYNFTKPGANRAGTVASTDVAATLTFKLGGGVELYVNPMIQNAFNNQAVLTPNLTVRTYYNSPGTFAPFDPFTTKPIECPQGDSRAQCAAMGANWQKGPNFGKAVQPTDYQTPRTFLVNVGVRF